MQHTGGSKNDGMVDTQVYKSGDKKTNFTASFMGKLYDLYQSP